MFHLLDFSSFHYSTTYYMLFLEGQFNPLKLQIDSMLYGGLINESKQKDFTLFCNGSFLI